MNGLLSRVLTQFHALVLRARRRPGVDERGPGVQTASGGDDDPTLEPGSGRPPSDRLHGEPAGTGEPWLVCWVSGSAIR